MIGPVFRGCQAGCFAIRPGCLQLIINAGSMMTFQLLINHALKITSDFEEALVYFGLLLLAQSDRAGAQGAFEKAMQTNLNTLLTLQYLHFSGQD